QRRLELVLMGDQKVATRAVPAGFVQSHELQRVYVDDQRQLALTGLASALWAGREADVRVRIQEKAVARRLLPQPPARLAGARPLCHQRISSMGSSPSSGSQESTRLCIRAAIVPVLFTFIPCNRMPSSAAIRSSSGTRTMRRAQQDRLG